MGDNIVKKCLLRATLIMQNCLQVMPKRWSYWFNATRFGSTNAYIISNILQDLKSAKMSRRVGIAVFAAEY